MVSYIHGFAVRFIAKLETGVGKSEVGLSEGGGGGGGWCYIDFVFRSRGV